MTCKITFRGKIETLHSVEGAPLYSRIKVPKITRNHCDMQAFRTSQRFSAYANSDVFPSVLARALAELGIKEYVRLDSIPAGVFVDTNGFLAKVTVSL